MIRKTLKDMERFSRNYPYKTRPSQTGDTIKVVSLRELKEEAIKWVKKWKLEIEEEVKTHVRGEFNQKISKLRGKIEATMELNNITEEDLK